jgi:hypothetical protein
MEINPTKPCVTVGKPVPQMRTGFFVLIALTSKLKRFSSLQKFVY